MNLGLSVRPLKAKRPDRWTDNLIMKKLLFIFLYSLSVVACNSKKETERETSKDALLDEVMKMHDEAMIPWGEIHNLNKQLEAKIEVLDSLEPSFEASQKYQQISQSLEAADAAMMGWMRQFNTYELQDMATDSAIIILQQEKASIEKVYNQVYSSVDSAKALLKEE